MKLIALSTGLWTGETNRLDLLVNIGAFRYSSIGNGGQISSSDIGNGFISASRISNNSNKIFRNGVEKANGTGLNTAVSFGNTYKYSILSGGGFNLFDSSNSAFHYISEGLNNTEMFNLYTAIQAFQTTLSRNV